MSMRSDRMVTRELVQEINKYFKDRGFNWLSIDAIASSSGDDTLVSEIHNGDWKHDHIAIDCLVGEFFDSHDSLAIVDTWRDGYEGSDGDWYTETHYWKIGNKSDRKDKSPFRLPFIGPISEAYSNEDRRVADDFLFETIEYICKMLERENYPFPSNYISDSWSDFVDGIRYGTDFIIESAECLIDILSKDPQHKFENQIKALKYRVSKWLKVHEYEESLNEGLIYDWRYNNFEYKLDELATRLARTCWELRGNSTESYAADMIYEYLIDPNKSYIILKKLQRSISGTLTPETKDVLEQTHKELQKTLKAYHAFIDKYGDRYSDFDDEEDVDDDQNESFEGDITMSTTPTHLNKLQLEAFLAKEKARRLDEALLLEKKDNFTIATQLDTKAKKKYGTLKYFNPGEQDELTADALKDPKVYTNAVVTTRANIYVRAGAKSYLGKNYRRTPGSAFDTYEDKYSYDGGSVEKPTKTKEDAKVKPPKDLEKKYRFYLNGNKTAYDLGAVLSAYSDVPSEDRNGFNCTAIRNDGQSVSADVVRSWLDALLTDVQAQHQKGVDKQHTKDINKQVKQVKKANKQQFKQDSQNTITASLNGNFKTYQYRVSNDEGKTYGDAMDYKAFRKLPVEVRQTAHVYGFNDDTSDGSPFATYKDFAAPSKAKERKKIFEEFDYLDDTNNFLTESYTPSRDSMVYDDDYSPAFVVKSAKFDDRIDDTF